MIRQANEALYIDSAGELTNPADDAVTCDTGAVTVSGYFEVYVVANASAAANFTVQHRNAANDANSSDPVGIYIPAGGMAEIVWPLYLNYGERVRVIMDDALTGTAWVSVNAKLVS